MSDALRDHLTGSRDYLLQRLAEVENKIRGLRNRALQIQATIDKVEEAIETATYLEEE